MCEISKVANGCTYRPGWVFDARLTPDESELTLSVSYVRSYPDKNAVDRVCVVEHMELTPSTELIRRTVLRKLWAMVGREEAKLRRLWLRHEGVPVKK